MISQKQKKNMDELCFHYSNYNDIIKNLFEIYGHLPINLLSFLWFLIFMNVSL